MSMPDPRTMHLGVIPLPSTAYQRASQRASLLAAFPSVDAYGLRTITLDGIDMCLGGDSYGVWGELADPDPSGPSEGVHVTVDFEHCAGWNEANFVKDAVAALDDGLPDGWRVADYVAITSQDDWSEDVRLWTRFDGLIHRIAGVPTPLSH